MSVSIDSIASRFSGKRKLAEHRPNACHHLLAADYACSPLSGIAKILINSFTDRIGVIKDDSVSCDSASNLGA
ncbi:hypothetical protein RESH_05912 [Rhodopirellula europaea SH398]|uniref:Uncharacterized protein n=1 Tax=Rhodopirellula europaea SH398 TaxID=1263868 RepID=M5SBG7_9BACT|nr:hypothetical protein RESH_05912 [Rhodopirellula europaea SH398]